MPIANTHIYIPTPTSKGGPNLAANVGTHFTQDVSYDFLDNNGGNGAPWEIGLVTDNTGTTFLQAGATVFPGVTLNTPSSGGYPTTDVNGSGQPTLTFQGNPVGGNATYRIYAKGIYTTDGTGNPGTLSSGPVVYYDVVVAGGTFQLSPAAVVSPPTLIGPAGTVGSQFISNAITIQNGVGPFYVQAIDGGAFAAAGLGISSTPVVPGTPSQTFTTSGNSIYVVGTPTSAYSGSFQLKVTDLATNPNNVYAGQNYTVNITTSGGGTLVVSKVSQTPATLKQFVSTSIQYGVTGGTPPYTWAITAGTLPNGLSLNTSSGLVSGTPQDPYNISNLSYNYPITIQATDSGSNQGTLNNTITITPNMIFTPWGVANGTVSQSWGPYTCTVQAGFGTDPGSDYVLGMQYSVNGGGWITGVPSWMTTSPVLSGGSTTGRTLQISGTPTTVASYQIKLTCVWTDSNGFSLAGNHTESFNVVQSTGTLNITGSLQSNPQHLSYTSNVLTATGGSGTYSSWVANFGSLSGFSLSSASGATTTVTGSSDVYGTFPITITVTDNLGASYGKTFSFTLTPHIWVTGSLPGATKGSSYNHTLQCYGGDNVFNTAVSTGGLPQGLSAAIASNGVLTISGTPTEAGTFSPTAVLQVVCGLLGTNYSQTVSLPSLVVSGSPSNVQIAPFGTNMCSRTDPNSGTVRVRIGGTVTGGTQNTFTVALNPNVGALLPAQATYASNQPITWEFNNPGSGTYTATLTSVDDGGVSVDQNIVLSAGSFSGPPTITPSGHVYNASDIILWANENVTLTGNLIGGCLQQGKWEFANGVTGNASMSAYLCTGSTNITAPSSIPTPVVTQINYFPNEAFDRQNNFFAHVPLILLPGTHGTLSITTSTPLDTWSSGVAHSETLVASGGTGSLTWSIISGSLPAGLTLAPTTGIVSGTTSATGTFTFVIMVADSASHYYAKTFTLTVGTGGGGDPTISSVVPNTAPATTPTSFTVNGTNFLNTDSLIFYSSIAVYSYEIPSGSLSFTGSTRIDGTTPNWGPSAAGGTDITNLYIKRSGNLLAGTTFTFTAGVAGLSVSNVTPNSVTVGYSSNLDITVYGTGFDGTCEVWYKPQGDSEVQITKANSYNSQAGSIQGTIPSTYFTSSYLTKPATVTIKKISDNTQASWAGTFQVLASTLSITTTQSAIDAIPCVRGNSYSVDISATGGIGTYTWSCSGTLPDGVTFSQVGSNGHFGSASVNNTATTQTVTVTVTDSASPTPNTAQKSFTITVSGGSLSFPSKTLSDARIGQLYSYNFIASGGTLPYTFTNTSGAYPNGLTLETDGTLHGTPAAGNTVGPYNFSIKCQDSAGSPASVTTGFSLNLLQGVSTVNISSISPTSGNIAGGTQVTINGSGFVSGCNVKFGNNVSSSVQFVSATQVIAITPAAAAAGAVGVTVTNPDSGNYTFNSFNYVASTAPVITSIDLQDGPFAGGQQVVLTGSNLQDVSLVKFGLSQVSSVTATIKPRSSPDETNGIKLTLLTPRAYDLPGVDGTSRLDVNIYATNPQGTGVLPKGDAGYTYRPAPIITAIVPNSGPTTGGQTVYIIGKNFFQRGGAKPRVFIGNTEVPSANITLIEQ